MTPARASKTAIIEAARALDVEAVRSMLSARPELLDVTNGSGRNLLHMAAAVRAATPRAKKAQIEMAALLLDRGLEIDVPYGRDACTALFEAVARARNIALVTYLLQRGADIGKAPGGGLFAAGWWEDLDILDVLLDAGADIDVVVGATPFLACWGTKRFKAAARLLERGADVNFQDAKGRTALHHAIEKEFEPARLRWLVAQGASPDIADGSGVTPRQKAARKRDKRYLAAIET